MNTKELCPLCEEGTLTDIVGSIEISHKGVLGKVNTYYSVCDYCKVEMSNHTQMYSNKIAAMEFYEGVNSAY